MPRRFHERFGCLTAALAMWSACPIPPEAQKILDKHPGRKKKPGPSPPEDKHLGIAELSDIVVRWERKQRKHRR